MPEGYSTIIDCLTLSRHLTDPQWRVMDCRFDLFKPAAGREEFSKAHIPGAQHVDLDRDLAGPVTATSGRHPLPDVDDFIRCIQRWGIGPETQVIVHDGQNNALAVRLWWMLRWLGHTRVAVLDGGFQAWQVSGYPLTTTQQHYSPTGYTPQADDSQWLNVTAVEKGMANDDLILIDARDPGRFAGTADDPFDKIAGHIPGALNMPFMKNLDAEGKFLPPDVIRQQFLNSVQNINHNKVVHSCGSGITACHNILAMEIAGLGHSYLYPGSWSEWITNPDRLTIKEKDA